MLISCVGQLDGRQNSSPNLYGEMMLMPPSVTSWEFRAVHVCMLCLMKVPLRVKRQWTALAIKILDHQLFAQKPATKFDSQLSITKFKACTECMRQGYSSYSCGVRHGDTGKMRRAAATLHNVNTVSSMIMCKRSVVHSQYKWGAVCQFLANGYLQIRISSYWVQVDLDTFRWIAVWHKVYYLARLLVQGAYQPVLRTPTVQLLLLKYAWQYSHSALSTITKQMSTT